MKIYPEIQCEFFGLVPCVLLSVLISGHTATAITPEQSEPRTAWWREARFGIFIHWGIYAVPADATDLKGKQGITGAEWYLFNKRMQVNEYEKFAPQLNPVKFDAKAWVKMAKDSGAKYIVFTAKHHDGFGMFGSRVTDWDVIDRSPLKRDPLKELAAECRKSGIRLCVYYSIMDWHHTDYLPRRPWEKNVRPAVGAHLSRYIDYMKGQLKELLTNYGPIGVLWFDGDWEHTSNELRSKEVNAFVRSLQPNILINNRNKLSEDFSTPEKFVPVKSLAVGQLWETCMPMNDTWGYAANDTNWKSAETIIRNWIDSASKGGNFLLNVGVTAPGAFPSESVERLARVGAWMEVNKSSIYGTSKGPFRRLPFNGRTTSTSNTLYIHVFDWPSQGLRLVGLKTPITGARVLAENLELGTKISRTTIDGTNVPVLEIDRPPRLDPAATVIELRLSGPPEVKEPEWAPTPPRSDGSLMLNAAEAEVRGEDVGYMASGLSDYIGGWASTQDFSIWVLDIPAARRYRVEAVYACPAENAGSEFTVGLESGAKLTGKIQTTAHWHDFQVRGLGELPLPAGRQRLVLRLKSVTQNPAMHLRQVILVPE